MKRITLFIISVVFMLYVSACSAENNDAFSLGLNAKILDVDFENVKLVIEGIDEDSPIAKDSVIDCSEAVIIYCDYSNGKVVQIKFEDLQVDDEIILGIYESELENIQSGNAKVAQIQLTTQRMN